MYTAKYIFDIIIMCIVGITFYLARRVFIVVIEIDLTRRKLVLRKKNLQALRVYRHNLYSSHVHSICINNIYITIYLHEQPDNRRIRNTVCVQIDMRL